MPLARLGKHKMGKACQYLRRLADVDAQMLESASVAALIGSPIHSACSVVI